ncbi:PAS domain S-box protein [Maribacter sp. MMG018]|uniref:PAS domain-containing sensor histidine kinase n=1 Tax=Maribacter sp. MMG018 TaxID=2822688 RepID=UPI001B35D00E|nr:PAS domain-containing sensor histidine kinase [Maribacter sp. MMG018]MBQ4914154.1 PAS domain S-box protein [Maribacter sp. MMG018]
MKIKLKPFFESSVDMLCIADYAGYFVDINPAFVNLLGYTKEELFSKKINEFVFEKDKRDTQQVRDEMLKNTPIVNFQNRYVNKAGDIIWLSWSAVPVEEEKLVYAIAKDITHEVQLRNQRIQEFSKLKNVNEDLFRINYTTSHDLRAPINNMLSLFKMLDYDHVKDDATLQLLDYIKMSAQGVKDSLENYLDLIQTVGEKSHDLKEVYFEEVLSRVLKNIGSLLTSSNTKMEYDFSSCESTCFNDIYIESVFLNLITNSVKYARPGIAPVINISTSIEEGQKQLIFSDEGQGFDMEKNGHKIFMLNERFDNRQEGKGIGLYLVYNQLRSLGGSISVDSEPDKGATFCIQFPS